MKLYPASLLETAAALRSSARDVVDFLEETCDRVEELDPHLHALVPEDGRRARLVQEAAHLKKEFPAAGDERPALFGVPVGVKDLFYVDGFPTRAGSQLPAELFVGPEASIVQKLRSLGALILGKTEMDEFAYADPSPTRNPHNLAHTPGGSSSGSAAAVAAGLCPLAIGTQTSRSITAPASFCGVVGYKPSYGRIPFDGAVLLSESLDTVGLITQDVASMAWAAELLVEDWQAELKPQAGAKLPVLGIPEGKYMSFLLPGTREHFDEQVQRLEQAGFTVKHLEMPWESYLDDLYPHSINLLCAEMAEVHQEWVQNHESLYRISGLKGIQHGQTITAEQVAAYREGQATLRKTLGDFMQAQGVDLLISPSQAGPAPEGYTVTGWGGMTVPWSYAGLPTISLPVGTIKQMPMGFQCIARFGEDERLLSGAQKIFEQLKGE